MVLRWRTRASSPAARAARAPATCPPHRLTTFAGYDPFFAPAEAFAPGIIRKLVEAGWPKDVIINVNFPNRDPADIDQVEVTRQTFRDVQIRHAEKRTDLRDREYYWMGFRQEPSRPQPGTDLAAIYQGKISVTPLHIDLTHLPTVHDLRKVLGGAPPRSMC